MKCRNWRFQRSINRQQSNNIKKDPVGTIPLRSFMMYASVLCFRCVQEPACLVAPLYPQIRIRLRISESKSSINLSGGLPAESISEQSERINQLVRLGYAELREQSHRRYDQSQSPTPPGKLASRTSSPRSHKQPRLPSVGFCPHRQNPIISIRFFPIRTYMTLRL